MASNKDAQVKGSVLLLLTAIIWGSSFFIVKNTVDAIPPNMLIALRFTGASALLAVVYRRKLKGLSRRTLLAGVVIGVFLYVAYAAQTIGIKYTTPGKNAFLTAIYCVLVPFIWWAVARRRPDGYSFAAAFICIAGIGLISLDGALSVSKGDALSLLSGVFFACQIVAISYFTRDCDAAVLTILQFAVAGALAWPFALGSPHPAVDVIFSAETIWPLLYLTVVVSAVGMLLQNVGQSMTPSSTAAILMSLESVFGVLFSVLFYGERLSVQIAVGFCLVFFAVILSETKLSFLRKRPA